MRACVPAEPVSNSFLGGIKQGGVGHSFRGLQKISSWLGYHYDNGSDVFLSPCMWATLWAEVYFFTPWPATCFWPMWQVQSDAKAGKCLPARTCSLTAGIHLPLAEQFQAGRLQGKDPVQKAVRPAQRRAPTSCKISPWTIRDVFMSFQPSLPFKWIFGKT